MEHFLDFWASNPDKNSRAPDPATKLYYAYESTRTNLANLKQRTGQYMIPVRSGKNLVPGFDPEKLDEVADLAAAIEAGEKKIGALARDIDEFMELCEGPRLGQLAQRRRATYSEIATKEALYKHTVQKLSAANPEAIPSEVENMPAAITAHGEWLELKGQREPLIDQLTERIEKAQKILAKY